MDVVVRELDGIAEWTAAGALYREVFGYTAPEWGLNPRLLAALRENGGTVIGALAGDDLVGFCYGFPGVEGGEFYHYSQAAVVAAGLRGTGVGRLLKYAQAAAARLTGAGTMRWVFDPYALRNAHFNFAVLGATGIRFLPDFYAEPGTDRVLVSWDLTRAVPDRADADPLPGAPAGRTGKGSRSAVVVAAGDRWAAPGPEDRAWLRQELLARFADRERLVDVVRPEGDPGRVAYLFETGEEGA
ncbi:GNAT family N-acetyltransferase [Actinoplanes oblitus]|uniref:GNAT family N-acetyltransferase n=1 Tax=Actinoplanes oblitus TaxID=3040509 RepID=A0ABY8WNL8_9ACTN|nr:GNAT family N-acetyltransferase [Actinoplanes oblitus]WIM98703.1 GNAT family N-acetyltransferase [Actinoplanes oblitus]